MNAGRQFQRQIIATYLRTSRQYPRTVDLDSTIDAIVAYLDDQGITPDRFRGFSFPATRHAIETALIAQAGGEDGPE